MTESSSWQPCEAGVGEMPSGLLALLMNQLFPEATKGQWLKKLALPFFTRPGVSIRREGERAVLRPVMERDAEWQGK